MHVHHLNTATMCPLGARFIHGVGSPLRRGRLVCHTLLLERPDGLVLVDGGLGEGDLADPSRLVDRSWRFMAAPRLDPQETALAQVRALGFSPSDVRHVVLTHLDVDHAGCVPDFPWATVHVHEREFAAALEPATRGERRRYVPAQIPDAARVRSYADGGEAWQGFVGARMLDDKDPDVVLVPLPGHTRGHCGVAVRGDRGWLFHAGDSYFFHGQVAPEPWVPRVLGWFQRGGDVEREARVQNQARVRTFALAHPEVRVFCSHDAVEFDRAVTAAAG
ncbi:MAG: MBL fold metallo-hydrolase [Deltaproteobacteria bacterium HGW-Deltaproteobacteria-14]|jgi:glyoxylase-like metal-dependent hydrolase (beta-lactamase superfamily II)|nr:MAG: MBL fold metallo-hydrolase [Deltaproteobacteria bacterium HGW-Deltaproteobacteria-14]